VFIIGGAAAGRCSPPGSLSLSVGVTIPAAWTEPFGKSAVWRSRDRGAIGALAGSSRRRW